MVARHRLVHDVKLLHVAACEIACGSITRHCSGIRSILSLRRVASKAGDAMLRIEGHVGGQLSGSLVTLFGKRAW